MVGVRVRITVKARVKAGGVLVRVGVHGEIVAVGVLEAVGGREEFEVSVHSAPGSELELGFCHTVGSRTSDKLELYD